MSPWELTDTRCASCNERQYVKIDRTVDTRDASEPLTRVEIRCRNGECPVGQAFPLLDSLTCAAEDLYAPWITHYKVWLRIDGDSDDPDTWHLVTTLRDAPCTLDTVDGRSRWSGPDEMTFIFLDGTPMVVVKKTDQVESAIPHHLRSTCVPAACDLVGRAPDRTNTRSSGEHPACTVTARRAD